MELFDFLKDIPYLDLALSVILALHSVALILVNLTATPDDDHWVATIYKYVEWFAGIVTPKAKE
jgi:hypothetical protein